MKSLILTILFILLVSNEILSQQIKFYTHKSKYQTNEEIIFKNISDDSFSENIFKLPTEYQECAEYYLCSSARNYAGLSSVIKIIELTRIIERIK